MSSYPNHDMETYCVVYKACWKRMSSSYDWIVESSCWKKNSVRSLKARFSPILLLFKLRLCWSDITCSDRSHDSWCLTLEQSKQFFKRALPGIGRANHSNSSTGEDQVPPDPLSTVHPNREGLSWPSPTSLCLFEPKAVPQESTQQSQ